jgi:hypothetical protein
LKKAFSSREEFHTYVFKIGMGYVLRHLYDFVNDKKFRVFDERVFVRSKVIFYDKLFLPKVKCFLEQTFLRVPPETHRRISGTCRKFPEFRRLSFGQGARGNRRSGLWENM